MGFRFRRSKKIAPGLRINISKSGPSITAGGKYIHTTVGHGRVTNSVRTPVKGLYYSSTKSTKGRSARSKNRTGSKSSPGILGIIGALIALGGIITIGAIILYLVIIAALLFVAYTYYKASKTLNPDQIERLGSILYADNPNKKYGAWTVYLENKRQMNSLPKDIASLDAQISSYSGEDVSALCDLLDEREQKQWKYQALREIAAEPDFYEPFYDNYYADAFKDYTIRSFAPVLEDAILLKTERGRKNRYTKFFDRFKDCYDRLPEAAAKELDSLMSDYGIRFSTDEAMLNGEVIDNV